jgi:hypothetical protein
MKITFRRASSLIVLGSAFAFACGGGAANSPPQPPSSSDVSAASATPTSTSSSAAIAPSASASSSATPSGDAQSVTFMKTKAKVGDTHVHRERVENRSQSTVTSLDGKVLGQQSIVEIESSERKETVMTVGDDGAVTKESVMYTQASMEGSGGTKKLPIEGKSYVVEAKDGKTTVTDANGDAVSDDEAKLVSADFKDLGHVDPMVRGLPDGPIAIGSSLDDVVKAILADDKEGKLQSATLKLTSAGDFQGTPSATVAITMTGKLFGGDAMTTLTGTATLRLSDGNAIVSDADGPLDVTQQGQKGNVKFSVHLVGTVHIHESNSW